MNSYQTAAWNLVKEVKEICEEQGISWFVSGRAAMRAYEKKLFYKGFFDVDILIPIADVYEFMEAVEKKARPERKMESLRNNPDFPGFYIKYVDTSTTMIHVNEGTSTKYKGIFVRIDFIRDVPENPEKLERVLEKEKRIASNGKQAVYFSKKHAGGIGRFGINRKRKACRMFGELVSEYTCAGADQCLVRGLDLSSVAMDRKQFSGACLALFENVTLRIPLEPERYFTKIADENWRCHIDDVVLEGKEGTTIVEGANNLASVQIPFAELMPVLRTAGYNKKLCRKRARAIYYKDKHEQLALVKRDARNVALRAGDLWAIHDIYSSKKERIRNLLEARQMDVIRVEFKEYEEAVMKYYRLKMGFYYDDELWDIYLFMLEAYGNGETAARLRELAQNDERLHMQQRALQEQLQSI